MAKIPHMMFNQKYKIFQDCVQQRKLLRMVIERFRAFGDCERRVVKPQIRFSGKQIEKIRLNEPEINFRRENLHNF